MRFLRKAGVAERYNIDPRSVDRWVASGKIPLPIYHKGSRIPLWDVAELDAIGRPSRTRPPSAPKLRHEP
jgi:predicted site-specific integrase-resolvase